MSELDSIFEAYRLGQMPSVKLGRTLYFDETNNIRKGVMGKEKDNNPELEYSFFVLGGIATKDPLDFEDLLEYIGARQKPSDAKYDFFVLKHRRFEDAIQQPRFRKLLEYLDSKDILIHFATLHYYHFALVDILDSLIEENDVNQKAALYFYKDLQSDMTEVLFYDFEKVHQFLYEYNFPNVPKDRANSFLAAHQITDGKQSLQSHEYCG